MRDREQIFSDYLVELRQREKEESRTHREKVDCILSSDDVIVRVKLMFCVLLQQPRHSDPYSPLIWQHYCTLTDVVGLIIREHFQLEIHNLLYRCCTKR